MLIRQHTFMGNKLGQIGRFCVQGRQDISCCCSVSDLFRQKVGMDTVCFPNQKISYWNNKSLYEDFYKVAGWLDLNQRPSDYTSQNQNS